MAKNFYRLFSFPQYIAQKQTNKSFLPVRLYARWMNRNPGKVLLPFEPASKPDLKKEKVINLDPEILKKSKNNSKSKLKNDAESNVENSVVLPFTQDKSKELKNKRNEKLKKRMFYLSQKKVFDDNNEIIYEKLNENDGRVSTLLVKLKTKKERLRSGQILVEGWRMIVEGLEAKCHLKYVVFSNTEDLNNIRPFLPKRSNFGVIFYKIPYKEIQLWSDVETSPGIIGIFEIPTPDNIKRLSRPLPLNFICDNIRVPGNLGAILRVAVGVGCEKVFLTKGCVDLWEPKVVRSAAGAHFRLPIHSSVEWEDMLKLLNDNTSVMVADSNAKILVSDDNDIEIDSPDMKIPVLPYYGVQYSSMEHITLILGGETESISQESYQFAVSKNGLRLNIPLQRGIDSLNTGMAAAVIAFEIRKQLIEAWTKAKVARKTAQAT